MKWFRKIKKDWRDVSIDVKYDTNKMEKTSRHIRIIGDKIELLKRLDSITNIRFGTKEDHTTRDLKNYLSISDYNFIRQDMINKITVTLSQEIEKEKQKLQKSIKEI